MESKVLPRPHHILELSEDEKTKFIESFDVILSAIGGVLLNVADKIDGATNGLKALAKTGKQCYLISNNSVQREDEFRKMFRSSGLDGCYSDIIHPAKSIVKYLLKTNFDGLIYCIGTENFKGYLRKAGFKLVDGPTKVIEEDIFQLLKSVIDSEPVRAVIIDADFNLSSMKLVRAHQYLKHPDCILISGSTDTFMPISKELRVIGPGPFLNILVEVSGKRPIVLAKPGKELGDMLTEILAVDSLERTLIIGDMLEQDIGFGKQFGAKTLLVLSGGTNREQMLQNKNPDQHPDYYADSMLDFVKFFEKTTEKEKGRYKGKTNKE